MTITSSLRYLYISRESGLLCAIPGKPRERDYESPAGSPTGHFLWNPGDFLNDEGVTSVRELRAAVMEWVRFIMSLPTAPPHTAAPRWQHGGAAPTPQRHATAAALFDYGRLWGSFSKGSLKNEGGICSTVVKTVGSLQFCNERDAS